MAVTSKTYRALFGKEGNFKRANLKDFKDWDNPGNRGSARLQASGLKGIIKWNPGPEILAAGVEECGVRLIANVSNAARSGEKELVAHARGEGAKRWRNPSKPSKAGSGLSSGVDGSGSHFNIYLYHGPRTTNRGHYYGRNIERSANQHGAYDHQTDVIMRTIFVVGPRIMQRMEGALVRNAGSTGFYIKLKRAGFDVF